MTGAAMPYDGHTGDTIHQVFQAPSAGGLRIDHARLIRHDSCRLAVRASAVPRL
jgi:hypothetical protein